VGCFRAFFRTLCGYDFDSGKDWRGNVNSNLATAIRTVVVLVYENKSIKKTLTIPVCAKIIQCEMAYGYTVYVEALVVPPCPVQLVWKNSPRFLSIRS